MPPLGGGKLDADWLKDRYSWRDENGKPLKPQWEEQDKAYEEKLGNLILKQKQFHNEEAKILVTAEEQEIFDLHAEELQKHPSVRKLQYAQMWEALKEAGASNAKGKPMKALMNVKTQHLKFLPPLKSPLLKSPVLNHLHM